MGVRCVSCHTFGLTHCAWIGGSQMQLIKTNKGLEVTLYPMLPSVKYVPSKDTERSVGGETGVCNLMI